MLAQIVKDLIVECVTAVPTRDGYSRIEVSIDEFVRLINANGYNSLGPDFGHVLENSQVGFTLIVFPKE